MDESLNITDNIHLGGEDVPLYKKVKKFILLHIKKGEWLPGTLIPSENKLVSEMGVSRSTVSRALRELTMAGYLQRVQGLGTYVASKKPPIGLIEIRSIAEEILERGGVYSCEVLLLEKERADNELSGHFNLPEGFSIYHSILLHKDSGQPLQLAERYVNPAFAPDYLKQDFSTITPSDYLFQQGPLDTAEHIIEAIMPDDETQGLLEISANEPCLVLHRRTWSRGVEVTKALFTYPATRIKLGSKFKPYSFK